LNNQAIPIFTGSSLYKDFGDLTHLLFKEAENKLPIHEWSG